MTSPKRSVVASGILVLLVGGMGVACGSDPAPMPAIPENPSSTVTNPPPPPVDAGPGGDAADAAPLQGLPPPEPPKQDEITDAFGVFVSKAAPDGGDGKLATPFNTIAEGMAEAALKKKRLYVCTGTYPEAVVLKDGVSVIANLVCTNPTKWELGESRTTIASPTSPAVTAKDIVSATRVDGFEVIAPAGSEAEPSSIALLAINSRGLTMSLGKLESGAGLPGADAATPDPYVPQLVPAQASRPSSRCIAGNGAGAPCRYNPDTALFLARPEAGFAQGGQVTCIAAGAPNLTGAGGQGGAGRLYISDGTTVHVLQAPGALGAPASSPPQPAAGASGQTGTFGPSGYSTGDGQPGAEARVVSAGGAGGTGGREFVAQATSPLMTYASSGAGGGAGGCPGRAAAGGKGGGASVAIIAIQSPIRLEKMVIRSGSGGAGGKGSFGTPPTLGQAGGPEGTLLTAGSSGAHGVAAGPSGHGAGGPSIAIAQDSARTTQVDCQVSHGTAGASPVEASFTFFPGQPARTIAAAATAVAVDTFTIP